MVILYFKSPLFSTIQIVLRPILIFITFDPENHGNMPVPIKSAQETVPCALFVINNDGILAYGSNSTDINISFIFTKDRVFIISN